MRLGLSRQKAFPSASGSQMSFRRLTKWLSWRWCKFTLPFHLVFAGPQPFRAIFFLLWPIPWKFRVPPPLPVMTLLNDRDLVYKRKCHKINYTILRNISLFCIRDIPLFCLYRLYESTCNVFHNEIMEESRYFFHQQPRWKLKDIPDPRDRDPVRYAILASIVEALVESFNFKISKGLRRGVTENEPLLIGVFQTDPSPPYEEAPGWCAAVGPLPDTIWLFHAKIATGHEHFYKRNILANVIQFWNF